MRKSDLVSAVADKAAIRERQADDVVSSFIELITNALVRGENVNLVGFGTFSLKQRQARSGRNPRSGAVITIHASRSPQFKAGKSLRDAVGQAV